MPDWNDDELTLAADLVSRNDWKPVRSTDPRAVALSALLSRGQLHPPQDLPASFRSPGSIQRKTYDLVTAEPGYQGAATRGGHAASSFLSRFRADFTAMRERAEAIRSLLEAGETVRVIPDDDGEPADEGGIVEITARRRERDPALRARKLAAAGRSGQRLACEACGFDFGHVYGPRGEGYIEVHHAKPLHVSGPTTTRLTDLVLLCANCHRICHRGAWITPDAVAALVRHHR